MYKKFKKIKEKGQTFVEYGVVIAVVACIAIAGLASAGNSINNKVTAMTGGSTEEPQSGTIYWGIGGDAVLTVSSKELVAAEKAMLGGQFESSSTVRDPFLHSFGDADGFRLGIRGVVIKDKIAPVSTEAWFQSMQGICSIKGIENLDTSKDTNMNSMFLGCHSLTSLDVSHFNTSNVTDMGSMFQGCFESNYSPTSFDVSNFDTGKVTDMSGMFSGCKSLTSLNVSSFNTNNVTDMSFMFSGCNCLTSLDVSHFSTSNVTDMSYMFYYCSKLTSLDTSKFIINAGTDTSDMYTGCPAHS